MDLFLVLRKHLENNFNPLLSGLFQLKDGRIMMTIGLRNFVLLPRVLSDSGKASVKISRIEGGQHVSGRLLSVELEHRLKSVPAMDGLHFFKDLKIYKIETVSGTCFIELTLSHSGYNDAKIILERI